jgi:S-methylmethionine-dependent homocysteine/selenocysteine methylase
MASPNGCSDVVILDGGMGRELKAVRAIDACTHVCVRWTDASLTPLLLSCASNTHTPPTLMCQRGAPFRQPEWSALALYEAPRMVQEVHESFIDAGAKVITTNSFAVVPFHIGEERFARDGARLAALSGQLARDAVTARASAVGRDVLVAASLPPPCGAYAPELFSQDAARCALFQKGKEQSAEETSYLAVGRKSLIPTPRTRSRILNVLAAGLAPFADIWLAETLSSVAEASAAAAAARGTGNNAPLWLAFSLRRCDIGCCLHSGESVASAATTARELGAASLLFNCAPPELMAQALSDASLALGGTSRMQLGVYANSFLEEHAEAPGVANSALTALRPELTAARYAQFAAQWRHSGATILGGCCGIGPAHIAQLAAQCACEADDDEQVKI